MITTRPYFERRLKLQRKCDSRERRQKELTAEHEPLRHLRSDCVGSWAGGGGVAGSVHTRRNHIVRHGLNESDLPVQMRIRTADGTPATLVTMTIAPKEGAGLTGGMARVTTTGAFHTALMLTAIVVITMKLQPRLRLHLDRRGRNPISIRRLGA